MHRIFLWVNKDIPVRSTIKRHVFGGTSKSVFLFFVGEFIAPERLWEDDFSEFWRLAYFFKMEGGKKQKTNTN